MTVVLSAHNSIQSQKCFVYPRLAHTQWGVYAWTGLGQFYMSCLEKGGTASCQNI